MGKEINFKDGLINLQMKLERKKLEQELNLILKTAQFVETSLQTVAPSLKTLGIKSILFNSEGEIVLTALADNSLEDGFKVIHNDVVYTVK